MGYFEAIHITKDWPARHIDFCASIEKGEMLGLVGQSGSGKSTILRMIAGLLPPDSGRIMLDGKDITDMPPGKRRIGMVFQDATLFPAMRVADNVAYGLSARGVRRREAHKKAEAFLARVGLEGFGKRWPSSLSGGEAHRVSLARTLIVEPLLVLFDEPLSALDSGLRSRMQEEIQKQQRDTGFTGILVTHDEDEAEMLCTNIVRLT